ncbi:hypothetical protein LO762_14575 [Actinocorallia sp. API 0066]|uniref:hypothetical protein n=1 Tax=Actinocorallia sp. API 0066 TaxID=2896846 RepID=UPI001E4ED4CB|nr:hypothetical protein [Actinocorallia sp. API 0066]MCD0450407.1 hypothetical protein [Actinocorallia sp. API 0066]
MFPTHDPDRVALLEGKQKRVWVPLTAWPRTEKELPQVEVDINWVRFSTENHRTRAEQMRAVHESGQPDLFKLDPLGPEAQEAQYQILSRQEGFDALKADLLARGQQESAILTAEGVLINGNRRSAALRSLYRDGHLKFQYVTCWILPKDATLDELLYLEAELQVARDFKQDYSWVNEALLIEDLYNREGKNWDRVAKRMHRKVAEVRDLFEKLQQVHQLVALSQGARLHVDFTENESAFDELAKHIKNKPIKEADSVKAAYFLGILSGAEYRNLRHLRRPDAADLVRRELEDDPALKPLLDAAEASAAGQGQGQGQGRGDELDDLLGEPDPQSSLHSMLGFVATKKPEASFTLESGDKVVAKDALASLKSAVTAAAEEAAEEQKDQGAVLAPLVRADKAIAELGRVLSTLPRARAFKEWTEEDLLDKISEMEKLIKRIRGN